MGVWVKVAIQCLIYVALLFGGAGTFAWGWGWAFLAVSFAGSFWMTRRIAKSDPGLLRERLKLPVQRGQPLLDKILVIPLIIVYVAWVVLLGLDAVRFRWAPLPPTVQIAGTLGLIASFWMFDRVFQANSFGATAVRIQRERNHAVASSGPYAIVRHPMYATAILFFAFNAMMLGSGCGLIASVLLDALLILRTALEDRTLRHELPGYAAYAADVRYRLFPFMW